MRINWIIQPPSFVRGLFVGSMWRVPGASKSVFITFDDGPVPEQTPWVLDLLKREGIRATFFCVGDNVRKHPDIFRRIVDEGHHVGNHTFHHVQLFRLTWSDYLNEVEQSQQAMSDAAAVRADLIRPPHGQMLPWRCWQLTRTGFRHMIFWDVMPKDYDNSLTPEQVFQNVKDFVRPGSIIVFHDSIKAGERMRYALESTIRLLKSNGWEFGVL